MTVPAALAVDPPPRSDHFNTGSWYDTPRANEELKKWRQRAGGSDDFRTQTQDCLSILDDVAAHERESQRFRKLAGENRGNGPVWRRYHWASMAQDQEWETGLRVPARCEARGMRASEIPPELSVRYGGRRIDDRQGPTPADGLHRHTIGEPARSSQQRIESTLPPGGRGMVFVRLPDPNNPSQFDPRHPGHVFNVRRHADGRLEYRDPQTGRDPTFWFHTPGLHVFFYRTR